VKPEQPKLAELTQGRADGIARGVPIDAESRCDLVGDPSSRVVPVTAPPDERGRDVQLMNLIRRTVEDDHFVVDHPHTQLSSLPRAFVCHTVGGVRDRRPPPSPTPRRAASRRGTAPASVLTLLEAAGQDRADLTLASFREEHVRWAVTTGLGPWLRRCTAGDLGAETSPLGSLVRAAELTARVIVAEQMDAMEEILVDCEPHVPPLTLLKGISICDQHYPEPHLRTMGDIDILVDEADIGVVESRLLQLGYRPESTTPEAFYATHHHIRPMFHPRRRVWVEIHRRLFPMSARVGVDRIFSLDSVRAELVPSIFRGRRVNRLSDELQVIYLASHWAFGMRRVNGAIGILDVMHLLKQMTTPRWERILAELDGSMAASYVYLLLTFIRRHRLGEVDTELLRNLALRQRSFGPATLGTLHAIIGRYVVNGEMLGPFMSARSFDITWRALLSPGPPTRNLLILAWNLLPSRGWWARSFRRYF
jgi:hypothetical protein